MLFSLLKYMHTHLNEASPPAWKTERFQVHFAQEDA